MNYWLVKSDPETYGWPEFVAQGRTFWDGVRNFQARNNLRAMLEGDLVMFYHSNTDPGVMGVAKVARAAYQDPTTSDPQWLVVDLVPEQAFARPVSLAAIKAEPGLANIGLIRQSRLSVMPLSPTEFDLILKMAQG